MLCLEISCFILQYHRWPLERAAAPYAVFFCTIRQIRFPRVTQSVDKCLQGHGWSFLTVRSCWKRMTRCCTAVASGQAPPSPRHSPPCPRRFESEELNRRWRSRPADGLHPEPSVTHCVPDAPRRLGFGGG